MGDILLLVAVFVVYSYQTAWEGQYLAEGDEYAVVYLAQGWAEKAHAQKDTTNPA